MNKETDRNITRFREWRNIGPVVTTKLALAIIITVAVIALGSFFRDAGADGSKAPLRAPQPGGSPTASVLIGKAQIEQLDIVMLNLLCAKGLNGAEALNPDSSAAIIRRWADRAKRETVSMIALIEPPMIALMEPVKLAPKATSNRVSD